MEQTNTENKMPTFLKVLCILTFVGAPVFLVMHLMSYFTYSAMAAGADMFGGLSGDAGELGAAMNSTLDMLGVDPGKIATSYLIMSLLNIPILIGAILMWKRKKAGYFVYGLFEIFQPLIPLTMGAWLRVWMPSEFC